MPSIPNGGTHNLQERYSNLVLAKLRKTTVFAQLFNTRYEGNPKAGAVKIPVRDTEVALVDYDIVDGADLSTSTTEYITLPIDKNKAVNELIDGYEAAAVPDNLVADRLDSAGYSMGKSLDAELSALCVSQGTALASTTALTAATVYDSVVDAVQALKKLGLSKDEMWLAVTNDTYGLLLKDTTHFVRASAMGDSVVRTGEVGTFDGVPVFETNNITDQTVEYILGNRVFCHFVDEWGVPVGIRDLNDGKHIGASALQGRRVYGDKISRSTTVLIKKKAA